MLAYLKEYFTSSYAKYKTLLALLLITIVWTALFLAVLATGKPWGDDLWFREHVRSASAAEWILYRWDVWSSRIFPELMLWVYTPISRVYWLITSAAFYVLYVWILYTFYKLFRPSSSYRTRLAAYSLICLSIWLGSLTVFSDAVFWLTGSINYFWVGVLFLIAMYTPVYLLVKNRLPQRTWMISSFILAVIICLSHEQFGLSFVIISLVALVTYYVRNTDSRDRGKLFTSKILLVILLLSVLAISCLFVSLNAPGNERRLKAETATHLPDMHSVGLAVRAEAGVRWFFERLINNTGLLLVILWSFTSLLVRKKKPWVTYTLLISSVLLLLSQLGTTNIAIGALATNPGVKYLFSFHAVWGYQGSLVDWLPIILWGIVLIVTLYGVFVALRPKPTLALIALSLLILSTLPLAALWLSPTMYVSGYRVVYVTSLIITFVLLILGTQAIPQKNSKSV